jgi:hypothetical protein
MGIQADCTVATQIRGWGKGRGDGTLSGPIGVVDRKCDGDSVVFETLVSALMAAGFPQPSYTQSTQASSLKHKTLRSPIVLVLFEYYSKRSITIITDSVT